MRCLLATQVSLISLAICSALLAAPPPDPAAPTVAQPWQAAPAFGIERPWLLMERRSDATTSLPIQPSQGVDSRVVNENLDLVLEDPEEVAALLLALGVAPPDRRQHPLAVTLVAPFESRRGDVAGDRLEELVRSSGFVPRQDSHYFVVRETLMASRVSVRLPLSILSNAERSTWSLALATAQATSPGITVRASSNALLVEVSLSAPRALFFTAERVTFSLAAAGVPRATLRGPSRIAPQAPEHKPPTLAETGRAYLTPTHQETPGAGLYTYLLIHSAPVGPEQRRQYLAAIEAFLRIQPNESLAPEFATGVLNTMYLPLDTEPPVTPNPDWLLDHYNYAKAQSLLSKFSCRQQAGADSDLGRAYCGAWLDGPYVLSYWQPLSHVAAASKPALFQDWTHKPSDVIDPWMRVFLKIVLTGNYDTSDEQVALSLRIRTGLSRFTAALGQLQSATGEIAALTTDLGKLSKDGLRFLGLVWPRK